MQRPLPFPIVVVFFSVACLGTLLAILASDLRSLTQSKDRAASNKQRAERLRQMKRHNLDMAYSPDGKRIAISSGMPKPPKKPAQGQ